MRIWTRTVASSTVLICLFTIITSMEADILSHSKCISCVCQVASNSPNFADNEGCVTDATKPTNKHQHSHAGAKTQANSVRITQGGRRPAQPRTNTIDHSMTENPNYHVIPRHKPRQGHGFINVSNIDSFNYFANNSHFDHPNVKARNGSNRNAERYHRRSKRSCGPFNLDIHYYIACGRPGIQSGDGDITAFQRCATNTNCAMSCIQNYTKMYEDTGHPGTPNCKMWSRIHFGHHVGETDGTGCLSPKTVSKWLDVESCLKGIAATPEPSTTNLDSQSKFSAKLITLPKPPTNNTTGTSFANKHNSTHKKGVPKINHNPTHFVSNRSNIFEHKVHVGPRHRDPSANPKMPNRKYFPNRLASMPNVGLGVVGSRHSTNNGDIHTLHLN